MHGWKVWEGYGVCSGPFNPRSEDGHVMHVTRRIHRKAGSGDTGGMARGLWDTYYVFVGGAVPSSEGCPGCLRCARCFPGTWFLVPERQGPAYGNDAPEASEGNAHSSATSWTSHRFSSLVAAGFPHAKTVFVLSPFIWKSS